MHLSAFNRLVFGELEHQEQIRFKKMLVYSVVQKHIFVLSNQITMKI